MAAYYSNNPGFVQPQMMMPPQRSLGEDLARLGFQAGFQGLGQGLNYGIRTEMEPTQAELQQQRMLEAQAAQPASNIEGEQVVGGISGAMSGAGTGAGVGSAIMPGIGTAVGAGVGTLVGGLGGALMPLFFEEDTPEMPANAYAAFKQQPKQIRVPQSTPTPFAPPMSMAQMYGVANPYGYV
jgi:hypothetical protein